MARNSKFAIIILVATSCIYRSNASPRQETVPSAKPPMIVKNPDGTLTVQKEPAKGQAEAAKSGKGLVIPPQIVVPFTRIPSSAKHSSASASHQACHKTKPQVKTEVEPTKPTEHQANGN